MYTWVKSVLPGSCRPRLLIKLHRDGCQKYEPALNWLFIFRDNPMSVLPHASVTSVRCMHWLSRCTLIVCSLAHSQREFILSLPCHAPSSVILQMYRLFVSSKFVHHSFWDIQLVHKTLIVTGMKLGKQQLKLIWDTEDQVRWREMTAYTYQYGTVWCNEIETNRYL